MKLTLRLFLFLVVLLGFTCEKKQDKPVLDEREPKGEMDLTNWDFQKQGYKKLDGNWRFYWKELRPPEDALLEVTYSHYPTIKVPGSWNDFTVDGKKIGGSGYATYALYLHLPPSLKGKILTLKIPHMGTAYRLFVDNELLAENGIVGKS
jgi:hypothetical protein